MYYLPDHPLNKEHFSIQEVIETGRQRDESGQVMGISGLKFTEIHDTVIIRFNTMEMYNHMRLF